MMIHKIHTGETMGAAGLTYIIVGFGGSHNDFSDRPLSRHGSHRRGWPIPPSATCAM